MPFSCTSEITVQVYNKYQLALLKTMAKLDKIREVYRHVSEGIHITLGVYLHSKHYIPSPLVEKRHDDGAP